MSEITQHFYYQRFKHGRRWTRSNKMEGNSRRSRTDAILSNCRETFQNVRINDPPNCNSDHSMLVATMNTFRNEHKLYIKRRKHIPFPEHYNLGNTEETDTPSQNTTTSETRNTEETDKSLLDLTKRSEKINRKNKPPRPPTQLDS